MGDALFVQEIQAGRDLFDDLGGLVFGKANVLLDARQQLAAVDLPTAKRGRKTTTLLVSHIEADAVL